MQSARQAPRERKESPLSVHTQSKPPEFNVSCMKGLPKLLSIPYQGPKELDMIDCRVSSGETVSKVLKTYSFKDKMKSFPDTEKHGSCGSHCNLLCLYRIEQPSFPLNWYCKVFQNLERAQQVAAEPVPPSKQFSFYASHSSRSSTF